MNHLLLSFIAFLMLCCPVDRKVEPEPAVAKCYGYTPCNACSSCNYCQYCNSGGTCGICAKPEKPKKESSAKPAKPAQCKATTKKGTRCSRAAKSNGYCWQHGGN